MMIDSIIGGPHGDATLDGRFNSSDLVSVFQVGKCENSEAPITTWAKDIQDAKHPPHRDAGYPELPPSPFLGYRDRTGKLRAWGGSSMRQLVARPYIL
jgi:hypothetical protein